MNLSTLGFQAQQSVVVYFGFQKGIPKLLSGNQLPKATAGCCFLVFLKSQPSVSGGVWLMDQLFFPRKVASFLLLGILPLLLEFGYFEFGFSLSLE